MKIYTTNLYYCFICDNLSPESTDLLSVEVTAFKAGWVIKLDNGQAKAICPNCTESVLNSTSYLRQKALQKKELPEK